MDQGMDGWVHELMEGMDGWMNMGGHVIGLLTMKDLRSDLKEEN